MLIIYLFGQLCLFLGGWTTLVLLKRRKLFLTSWGVIVSGWYFYLLVYYGPTSVYAVLAAESGEGSSVAPWFLNINSFGLSLWAGLSQQILPLMITIALLFFFSSKTNSPVSPWSRLEPLLIHPSTLIFGIVGTGVQVLTSILYASSGFVFADLNPFEKLICTMFLIFTFGPQIALVSFQFVRSRADLMNSKVLDLMILLSLISSILVFSSFTMRTYAMSSSILLFFWAFRRFRIKKIVLLVLLPTFLVITFASASVQRISYNKELSSIPSSVFASLQYNFSYRSGFGTDSVVIGARQCISSKLITRNPFDLIVNELILGFPSMIRRRLSPSLFEQKLEVLVGDCYKQWLNRDDLRVDLLDTKAEYFLAVFGPFIGGPMATFLWLGSELFVMIMFTYLFAKGVRLMAFMAPAFTQVVIFASTPAEFIVFFKAALPTLCLIGLILYLCKSKFILANVK